MRRILWVPWLIIVVAWPATLLGWYYISLAADPSWLRDRLLLDYLVALLILDSAICLAFPAWATVATRAVLRAGGPLSADGARAAWIEALRLPQRTAWLIVGLIVLTATPVTLHLLSLGEHGLVFHGWVAAAIVGICELTFLFPMIQATTLPFLRRLKAEHPELSLADAEAPAPPQRAYFVGSLLATGTVASVLVARLVTQHAIPPADGAGAFPSDAAIALTVVSFAAMFGGIGFHLYLSVLLPLRSLAGAMTRFAAGQAVPPLGLPHVGEIGILAEHFDGMVAALGRSRARLEEREGLLRHAQRFDAMGTMAASLVHELANPLAGARLSLALATDAVSRAATRPGSPPEVAEAGELLRGVREATDLMGGLVLDLKSFGRRDGDDKERCVIPSVIEMALRIVRTEARGTVSVERDYRPAPPVTGNALRLTQVFVNLLLNALEAARPGVPARILVGVRADGGAVEARVGDNGIGIGEEVRRELFEPMCSRKADGTGSGLGLYVCRQIVEAHGGWISCASEPGQGSTFVVRIPAAGPAQEGARG